MFNDSKYTVLYYKIIDRALIRANRRIDANKILGYSERHHIIPKCLGGFNKKDNLVYLSAREHFICHLLLIKIVDKDFISKMKFALGKFIQSSKLQDRKFTSRQYEIIRKAIPDARSGYRHSVESKIKISNGHKGQVPWNKGLLLPSISEEHKKILSSLYLGKSFDDRFGNNSDNIKKTISLSKIGKPSGMLGKSHTEETKERMRIPKPSDFGQKISEIRQGIIFSDTHLENIKKANKENGIKRRGIKRTQISCPHCGKIGGNSQMKRYHFDNCKNKG